MKVCFAGKLYGEAIIRNNAIKKSTVAYAIQKFSQNFVDAIGKNYEILVLSPVKSKKKVQIKEIKEIKENITFKYLFYFGLFGRISLMIQNFLMVLKKKPEVVCVDALNISQSIGIVMAKPFGRIKVISIVTDIPEDVLQQKNNFYAKAFQIILKYSDGFVFLTELANRDYNVANKPYAILEGIARKNEFIREDSKELKCVYAGGLAKKYYVKQLAEAFAEIAKDNEYLYFFGDGECREDIITISQTCPKVKYMGTVDNKEIMKIETNADLLINPRPNIGTYTKYSFPSKIIEYMTSGTPILANKLDGIPEEFYNYMFLFDGYSYKEYALTLRRILDMHRQDRELMGRKAEQFIMSRNGIEQAHILLEKLINEI